MDSEGSQSVTGTPGQPGGEADGRLRQASRAVAWNGVLSLVMTVFAVAANIVTVRLLTQSQYGLFSYASNWLRYASIISLFTLDAAVMRYVPEYRARGDRRGMVNLVWKVIGVHLVVWFVLTIVTALTSSHLSDLGRVPAARRAEMMGLMATGIAVVLPSVLYVSLQAVLTSFFAVRIQAIGAAIGGGLQLVLLWLFVRQLGWGGPGAMLAQLGLSGFLVALFALQVFRLPFPEQTSEYRPIGLRRLLMFSLPYVINGVAGAVFLRQSEVLFLQPYWGSVITATYSYAYMLAQRFLEFVPAVLYGVGNVLSSTAILEGREQLAKVMGIYWRVTAATITGVSIGGACLSDRLAVLFYGAKALEASQYATILFVTQAVIVFVNPYNFVMRAEEKTWLSFWLSPPAAAISLAVDFLLIPRFGLVGAVVATSISFSLVTLLQYAVFRRVFPYLKPPLEYFARCYVAALPILLVLPLKHLVPGHLGLLAGIVAAMGLWIAGARAMKLVGPAEADLLERSGLPGRRVLLKALAS